MNDNDNFFAKYSIIMHSKTIPIGIDVLSSVLLMLNFQPNSSDPRIVTIKTKNQIAEF